MPFFLHMKYKIIIRLLIKSPLTTPPPPPPFRNIVKLLGGGETEAPTISILAQTLIPNKMHLGVQNSQIGKRRKIA